MAANFLSSNGLSSQQQAVRAIAYTKGETEARIASAVAGIQPTAAKSLNEIQTTKPLTGDLDLRTGSHQVLVPTPTTDNAAATKRYVDDHAGPAAPTDTITSSGS